MSVAEGATSALESVTETDPPQLSFQQLDASNLSDFRLLNQSAFPVKYSDKFYQDCRSAARWTQLAFDGSKLLGAIACRLEVQSGGKAKLYVMSLAVQAAYRGQAIGSWLLERMLSAAGLEGNIFEAYLHVHVNNEDAINFYTKRGFQKSNVVEHYYRRLQPPHALILRKRLQDA